MHRPLRVPFYLRLWHLVRGLLFYNTVYWRRASDGLNMPSLSQEERERQRPARNLEIIKPRMRPRAHIEVGKGGEVSHPNILPAVEPLLAAPADEPATDEALTPHHGTHHVGHEHVDEATGQVYVKRRRYRRRLVSRGSAIDRGGFLARVFGKK